MPLSDPIIERVLRIEEKYESIGQDMVSYLDGLLHLNSLTYWDYIHLETLLSIQNTRTDIFDEKIFITYHQITELYFSLILHELDFLCNGSSHAKEVWLDKITRINRYFSTLIDSFSIMIEGLDKESFLKFRMSLLPASGFQSVQYRKIELYCTKIQNLVSPKKRDALKEANVDDCYEVLYWKFGNLSMKTGHKTLTLQQFEQKYDPVLKDLAHRLVTLNIYSQSLNWPKRWQDDKAMVGALKTLDRLANLEWPRQHMKAAVFHLHQKPEVLKATGGTNWQEYLPPKKQAIHFFEFIPFD